MSLSEYVFLITETYGYGDHNDIKMIWAVHSPLSEFNIINNDYGVAFISNKNVISYDNYINFDLLQLQYFKNYSSFIDDNCNVIPLKILDDITALPKHSLFIIQVPDDFMLVLAELNNGVYEKVQELCFVNTYGKYSGLISFQDINQIDDIDLFIRNNFDKIIFAFNQTKWCSLKDELEKMSSKDIFWKKFKELYDLYEVYK